MSRSIPTAGLLLLAALLTACALDGGSVQMPAPQEPPLFDNVITQSRIGPISIGMPGTDVMKILGSPASSEEDSHAIYATWSEPAVVVGINKRLHFVCSLSTIDARYATPGGVHVGSTQLEVELGMGASKAIYYPGGWKKIYGPMIVWGNTDGHVTSFLTGYREYCE